MTENDILALSWKQPFASLMLHGKIETRTWSTKYRGYVLICASKKSYTVNEIFNICGGVQYYRIINTLGTDRFDNTNNGYAIAIGKLTDCRPMEKEDEDKCFVIHNPNLWCHIYEDVKPIQPFPFKGHQGWTKLDKETFDKIHYII